MTENDTAVNTLLLYCMKQMSLISGCEAECNEEIVLATMLTVLKVGKFDIENSNTTGSY